MEMAVGAARWVVGRALGPVTDGVLESWAASSELGPNVRALKLELLYAQGMLNSARGRDRDVHNPALGQLLLELRNQAYDADDVLDELDYFRIQDELEGTYETIDAVERGLVGGLVLNARHTAAAVTSKLKLPSCSCAAVSRSDAADEEQEETKKGCLSICCSSLLPKNNGDHQEEEEASKGCLPKVISSAPNTASAIGKCLPCYSLPSVHQDAHTELPSNRQRLLCGSWFSKAQRKEHSLHAPKLKFNRVELSKKMVNITENIKHISAKVSTILLLGPTSTTTQQGSSLDQPRMSTPQIIEPKLYGRDNLKKKVIHDLTQGKYGARELTVLSIVGSGGIGKTTFTQYIYQEVNDHFQVRIWICVSQNFNANKLSQDIVKQIPRGDNEKGNLSDEEKIQIRLLSKRFLLVLDDMWTYHEDEWNKLLTPFKKGGTHGNVVIVTTRIPKVANMVVTTKDNITRLDCLEHNECMDFFKACVFVDPESWEKHPRLHGWVWQRSKIPHHSQMRKQMKMMHK